MPETVVVHAPDGELPVFRFPPESPNGAAVVVVQEIFGVSDYIMGRCQDLANAGYLVYAPILYSRLTEMPVLDPASPDYLMQGMTATNSLDWDVVARDIVASVDAVRAEPGISAVGLLGFCFGGGLAFDAASRAEVDALVSYYGSALPRLLDLAPRVSAPQLHHWGTQDSFIDADAQASIREALAASPGSVQWEVHEGAGHAFDNNETSFLHPEARAAAWPVTLQFLARNLVG